MLKSDDNFLTGSSNETYHANKTHLSSSSIKMLLKEPERFYEEHFLGIRRAGGNQNAFDEGTAVHLLLLEPELFESSVAVFEGLRKHGTAFESFKEANKNKIILSAAQLHRVETLAASAKKHKVAMELLSNGKPEHTMLSEILDVPVKMRADYIVPGSYIVDVKTTSSPSGSEMFKATIQQYMYDLSAALYCQIAYDNTQKLHDFFWLVLSKADNGCTVYKASSQTLTEGSAFVTQGIIKYKQCLETNLWTSDSIVSKLSDEVEEI